MFRPHLVLAAFVCISLLWSKAVLHANGSTDWMRGSGKQMELRLRGEVFDAAGRPATGATVTGSINSTADGQTLEAKVSGHRFEVWIPVNQRTIYSILLKATLNGTEQLAYKRLSSFALRQLAIDGIQITLQVPTRQVEVKVVDRGMPVSNATLKAELDYLTEQRSQTDENGIVRLKLLPDQTLTQLTAWTEDFRIGGYGFNRTPARDPKEDEHVVELSSCRNLKMRFEDQSGNAVPGVDFLLHVGTPAPNFNHVGQTENTRMRTDSNGEALYRWFPDWKAHIFNAESTSDLWYIGNDITTVEGKVIFKLTRSKLAERKRVSGTVLSSGTGVGGFFVSAQSFQSDQEGHSDHLSTFTNEDGTFSVDVLPDATYCSFVVDSKWVSNIINLIPYQSVGDKIINPELTVSAGQQVEVLVTTGPDRNPYPNLGVSFETEYRYSFRDGDEKRNGNGGPRWFLTTDATGRIRTPANLGKLNVSVYSPLWQIRESHDVSMGQPTRITLHREIEAKLNVKGQLVLQTGLDARIDDAAITIGALGGNSRDSQTLKSDSTGAFAFETSASPVGVFARTKDGLASGMIVLMGLEHPIELTLSRTLDYAGQLIGADGKPSVGVGVIAKVRVEGNQENTDNHFVGSSFEATSLEAITDQQGNYKIFGVPSQMKVSLSSVPLASSERRENLGDIWLEVNESRPIAVSKLGAAKAVETTIATRFEKIFRDSKLLGFPVMVILSDKSKSAAEFVNANFVDYKSNQEVASYLQFVVIRDSGSMKDSDATFLKDHHWQLPSEGRVFACVFDAAGGEKGRLEVDVTENDAIEEVAAFISKHLPAKVDAKKKWEEAFAEATRTNRKVFARLGGRYCGPCFLLARWLDDHRELLERDYVMLKIDGYADENGLIVANRITRGGTFGIPFFAIFDNDRALMIDSASPLGNIGFPSGYEGRKQIRKMLLATRSALSVGEVENIVASLRD